MIYNIENLNDDLISVYTRIEYQLICEIAKRIQFYDKIGGSFEWQIKKLDELGKLNADCVKIISALSGKSREEVAKMLMKAGYGNIDMDELQKAFDAGQIDIEPAAMLESTAMQDVFSDAIQTMNQGMQLIQTRALESAKQEYMTVLNQAYIEVSTGTYDYNTSIRRALNNMAKKGITGATYMRSGTVVHYSLEGTVRRDTMTAVHQLANRTSYKMCNDLGCDYVEISAHLGARVNATNPIANHAGWQGKIFKVHGSDEEYGNLKENTGYPDDILGLGGVNCRHRMYPFFKGISTPQKHKIDEVENEKVYKTTQKQRAKERAIRSTIREMGAAYYSGDREQFDKLKSKLSKQREDIALFCIENKIPRQAERESIIGGIESWK